jgi:hypothetical protein
MEFRKTEVYFKLPEVGAYRFITSKNSRQPQANTSNSIIRQTYLTQMLHVFLKAGNEF